MVYMADAAGITKIDRFFQFSLVGMLASGFLALASSDRLDGLTEAALAAALALRMAKVAGWLKFDRLFENARAVAVLMLAAVCFYPLDGYLLSGSMPLAGVHLAVLLSAIKIVSARTSRDYAFLNLIAVTELAAAAMLALTLAFFGFLALFLFFSVAALASGEARRSALLPETVARAGMRAFGRRLTVASFVLCGGILTMTAALFFVLPRAARGALSSFMPDGPHLPGFADKVRLDDIGRIQQSSRAVMHIQLVAKGAAGDSNDSRQILERLRWRGGALTHFDGETWDNPGGHYDDMRLAEERGVVYLNRPIERRPGREIAYQVQLDEIASDTLFFAGTPETIRLNCCAIWRSSEGAYHVQGAPSGLVYSAYSFVEDESAPVIVPPGKLTAADRAALTQVPRNLDPRIPALAVAMAGSAASDEEKARAIERRLRHDYGYTLELPSKRVSDPLANFLFTRKKGHCEYFASALAVMLRTLDIPTRVVTGFQSGEFNPLTGWQVVRASDAHSWVEAWLEDSGWTTLDATPPAEPESEGMLGRLALFYDAADQFWQDWVLRYDLGRQVVLAQRVHQWRFDSAPDGGAWWEENPAIGRRLVTALMAFVAVGILLAFYGPDLARWWKNRRGVIRARRGQGKASDATALYLRMLTVLARRGFEKPAWLTPAEFVRALPESEMAVLVDDLTSAYNEARFGGRREAAPRMIRLLDRLESWES